MDDRKLKLMGQAPVKSAIIRLAIPTMLASVVQILYNLTDTLFIGMLGDKDLVAAISLAIPLVFVLVAVGNVFGVGAASYISRQLGAGKFEEARHANAVAAYTAAGGGAVLSAAMFIFRGPLLSIVGTSPDTFGPTMGYFGILIAFGPLLILQVALAGLVRSEGATSKAMWGMVIGLGSNIILDPLFIFEFGMGIEGAAWATVIGNGLGTLFYLLHFMKGRTVLSIKREDFKPSARIYSQTFEIGIPAALSMLIMSASFIVGNIFAAGYGDDVVAGFGINQRINSTCIMLIIGLTQGYQPFAGYNFGAKHYHRLAKGLKTTMLYSTVLAAVFLIAFQLFAREIVSVFLQGEAGSVESTVEAGVKFLKAFSLGLPFIGLQITFMVTFQATGKALRALLIALGRQLLIFLPLLVLLDRLFGFGGLIYAQPAADIISTIGAVLMSISFLKQLKELERAEDEARLAVAS